MDNKDECVLYENEDIIVVRVSKVVDKITRLKGVSYHYQILFRDSMSPPIEYHIKVNEVSHKIWENMVRLKFETSLCKTTVLDNLIEQFEDEIHDVLNLANHSRLT